MSKFMLGNVDKNGQLEQNDLELNESHLKYLDKVFEVDFTYNVIGDSGIKHSNDAVDYMDIDELIEDNTSVVTYVDAFIPQAVYIPVGNAPIQLAKPVSALPSSTGKRLKFSDIFGSQVDKNIKLFRGKSFNTSTEYYVQKDSTYNLPYTIKKPEKKKQFIIRKEEETQEFINSVLLDHWEEKIIYDSIQYEQPLKKVRMFRNEQVQKDWSKSISWDEPTDQPEFHLNDPTLILLEREVEAILNPPVVKKYKKEGGKLLDYMNISEDHKYEEKKQKHRVRQTHGPIKLQHSIPAARLHPQYFKPLLHVKELRSFHRPKMKFPVQETIQFSKVRTFKKKKYKVVDPAEMMRTPKDITLKDTSKFVLVEYCEEFPPALQNIGMSSLIYNYYRKKNDKDNFIPKMDVGGPLILDKEDVSPFFNFGDVKPGQTMQVLFNNLFRAPLFEQDVLETDFLCIRQTYRGVTKYYLREIPHVFVVGQCYPMQEVPRPQARKITQALKTRLQVVSYRLMRQDPNRRLQYDKLRKQFPMFTDSQIRGKLKEFAQYSKKGENTGWWKLKPSLQLPDEDGIRKMVTPESICLQESTLVAQQRLKDCGYGVEIEDEEEDIKSIEVQLAPWITTKNFIVAASGKGMVQLFGPGDPTGCGEGFSYIRASMKEMFFHHDSSEASRNAFIDSKTKSTYHKYSIVEQQKVYKAEIERIWGNQMRSLSRRRTLEEKKRELEQLLVEERQKRETQRESMPNSPTAQEEDDDEGDGIQSKTKVLVINRLVQTAEGGSEWKSEVVSDARVINAYIRHRKMIEKEQVVAEGQEKEDVKERIKRRTKAHVVRLHIKQGRLPPLADDEDISESELPPEEVKPVKKPETDSPKKKKEFPTIKLVSRRRQQPEYELGDLLEKIICSLIDVPEAASFVTPVSQSSVPDYYEVIKEPLCLEQIRERTKLYLYKSSQDFLNDLNLVANNCERYNGALHPLTGISKQLISKAVEAINAEKEKITKLESELGGDTSKAGAMNLETAVGNVAGTAVNEPSLQNPVSVPKKEEKEVAEDSEIDIL